MIVMLHGVTRSSKTLAHWRDLLPDLTLLDLPGHGQAPPLPRQRIEDFADHVAASIPKGALIVGESLGGVVALELGGRGWPTMAFDPFLSTAKLWVVQASLRAIQARSRAAHLPGLMADVFGVMPDGSVEERNNWPLLDRLSSSADIITGTAPLWPSRPITGEVNLLDEIDAYHLRRHPKVRFHQIEGPHSLLTHSVDACRELILARYSESRA